MTDLSAAPPRLAPAPVPVSPVLAPRQRYRLLRRLLAHRSFQIGALLVLALTVANHPGLLFSDYDEIAIIEYENRDLQRLWSALLGIIVIQSIANGLTLLNLSSSLRYMITGGVLAIAVIVDSLARQSRVSHGRA